jgi:hypothetical protein
MSNVSLLVLSIIIILSSLSEKLEFFVHNEEVLLTLCFIAFIFFAYSYLSDSISEDFQKKVEGLENQLFGVLSEKFSSITTHFEELFLFKYLGLKLSIMESLVDTRLSSNFLTAQPQVLKDSVNALTLSKLMEIVRAEAKIVEELQKKTMKSVLISLVLSTSSYSYVKPLKQAMLVDNSSTFFAKVSAITSL